MINYLARRLALLPITLFAIILVNFVILNLVPGDPVSVTDRATSGDVTRSADMGGSMEENQHLLFREHYGLTLPILLNLWWHIAPDAVHVALNDLSQKDDELSVQNYHQLKTLWGDRARFIMPILLDEIQNQDNPLSLRKTAVSLFIRGGTKQGYVGPTLSEKQKLENRQIAANNQTLNSLRISDKDSPEQVALKVEGVLGWYTANAEKFNASLPLKVKMLFFETRFFRYLSRVTLLDFGTMRNDNNKTVISEVASRIKYSLTLAVVPMLLTFCLCQFFGMTMAVFQNKWPDVTLNILFLILFAVPIFVVAPFLIEKVALPHTVPFTNIPIPFNGFHSPEQTYHTLTSIKRFGDISLHLFLPLVAIMYGTLAVQARLSRTAFLEVLKQDFVRTAHAKGLPKKTILIKHVGRNGAITIVTSLAASLGVILGGSLIIETIFEINGFGRFFYQAILNRDYNVVLFSAFASSLLTLVGYIIADVAYTLLDPRVALD